MKKAIYFIAISVLVLVLPEIANAQLINFDFETGDFTGWSASGNASVVTSHSGNSTVYSPVEGSYFAQIIAGNANTPYKLSQSFDVLSGQSIGGWAAFDYRDYHSFYDWAKVEISNVDEAVIATPWTVSGASVPNYTDGPWTEWNWTAPSDGTYFLTYSVANYGDSGLPSYGLFDAGAVTDPNSDQNPEVDPIPEPASIFLFASGLLGLAGFRKR